MSCLTCLPLTGVPQHPALREGPSRRLAHVAGHQSQAKDRLRAGWSRARVSVWPAGAQEHHIRLPSTPRCVLVGSVQGARAGLMVEGKTVVQQVKG